MSPKPIVYIDLIGTLAKWRENEYPPIKQIGFKEIKELNYPTSKWITRRFKNNPSSYRQNVESEDKNLINSNENHKEICLLENYLNILKELRENCELRLISSLERYETLQINSDLSLDFDKRYILGKEDLYIGENDYEYISGSNPICPDGLLISNHPSNSKVSKTQRQALGIEPEQQVLIQMLEIKALTNTKESEIKGAIKGKTKEDIKLSVVPTYIPNLAQKLDTKSRATKSIAKYQSRNQSPSIQEMF